MNTAIIQENQNKLISKEYQIMRVLEHANMLHLKVYYVGIRW